MHSLKNNLNECATFRLELSYGWAIVINIRECLLFMNTNVALVYNIIAKFISLKVTVGCILTYIFNVVWLQSSISDTNFCSILNMCLKLWKSSHVIHKFIVINVLHVRLSCVCISIISASYEKLLWLFIHHRMDVWINMHKIASNHN